MIVYLTSHILHGTFDPTVIKSVVHNDFTYLIKKVLKKKKEIIIIIIRWRPENVLNTNIKC